MATDRPDFERLREILEQWFTALDHGERPDLAVLCGGDAALESRLRSMLDSEPQTLEVLSAVRSAAPEIRFPKARLGEFRLVAPIGAGGMGTVFLAEQEPLRRMVALKVLEPTRHVERFRREASIAAALDHPNIVPIHAIGEDDGYAFIAMKWLSGPDLEQMAKPLTPEATARLGLVIARALEEAHRSGVVHRDVKPGNIIFDGGTPYLVDFGLARSRLHSALTEEGAFLGTLEYTPPELLRGGAGRLDARSDVYSLGATLYEAATGRRCFEAQDRERLVREILLEEPPVLGLPHAAHDLATIILRALRKEKDGRFETAGEMADDLERFLAGEPIRARRVGAAERAWRRMRRHPRVAAAVGGLLLVALLLAAVIVVRDARDGAARDESVAAAERALGRGETEVARGILASLPPRLARATGVEELRRRIEAWDAREELLDATQDRTEGIDPRHLRALAERVRRLRTHDDRPRLAWMAGALASLRLGEVEEVRAAVRHVEESWGRGRDTISLLAVADGRAEWTPPAEPAGTAAAHVIAALALRHAGAAPDVVRTELELARRSDDTSRRARLVEAHLLYDERRYEEALRAFRFLVRPHARNDSLYRQIALIEMIRGRLPEARAALARVPRERRVLLDADRLLLIAWREGDEEAFGRTLEEAMSRWPQAPELLLAAMHLAAGRLRWAEVERLGHRVLDVATWYGHRDRACAEILRARFHLRPVGPPAKAEDALSELGEDAEDRLPELRLPQARAIALTVQALVLFEAGDLRRAMRRLDQAAAEEPDDPAPRLEYAARAYNLAASGQASLHTVQRALEHARAVTALWDRQRLPVPPDAFCAAHAAIAALSLIASRQPAAEDRRRSIREEGIAAADAALSLLDRYPSIRDPRRHFIETIRRQLR